MKERPILFSAPMVRAILAGTKTQTRRAVKLDATPEPKYSRDVVLRYRCPYGQPGDRLWVRETWMYGQGSTPIFRADVLVTPKDQVWRSPIHMPRAASRITLEITGVRVERLQDISEADAVEEGAPGGHGAIPGYGYNALPGEHYRHVWESINGPSSWDANPWIWAIEFKRVEGGHRVA